MNPKENDNEIIELTDEELNEIFADDDFDNGEDGGEIRSFYFSNPDPYAKGRPRSDDALREIVKAVYVDAPDKSSGKRRQKAHIEYDLMGYIPVDELLKAEQA